VAGDERATLLRWYVEMGADEAIDDAPNDRFAKSPRPSGESEGPGAQRRQGEGAVAPSPAPSHPVSLLGGERGMSARAVAEAAMTLDELRAAVMAFEGCALKRTATHTVFADGVPGAPLMVIGEAPGGEEDRLGLPFVGRSGQLLDRMLAAIGHDRRQNAYISNILFWRPPGNRKPTDEETALCLPFVWRHIVLADPRAVLLCGGTAVAALLGRTDGITRLRGRWVELPVPGLERPVPVMPTYHPSFLLRTPQKKNEAWRDLLELQSKLLAK
jgi:uracil-DNA glycosylase